MGGGLDDLGAFIVEADAEVTQLTWLAVALYGPLVSATMPMKTTNRAPTCSGLLFLVVSISYRFLCAT
jgi:hypothetical protein